MGQQICFGYCYMLVFLTQVQIFIFLPQNFVDPISHAQLAKIANELLTKWEELSPSLGLTQPQEVTIRKTHRDYADQKREVLYMWKKNKGNEATYGSLIAAAEDTSNKELADGIRDLLKKLQGMYTGPTESGLAIDGQ